MTGLTHCWRCKGRIHSQYVYKGQPRLGCYNRQKDHGCTQKSANLSVYEAQVLDYLATFHIPEDYHERIVEAHRKLEAAYDNAEEDRERLERQLKRVKELYEWGDYTRADYQARRGTILKELEALSPRPDGEAHLEKLARFLADVPAAWVAATPDQRSKLSRTLFEQVWLRDKQVVAVKPRPELAPFFQLNYEEFLSQEKFKGDVSTRVELHLNHGVKCLITSWVRTAERLPEPPALNRSGREGGYAEVKSNGAGP